MITDSKWQFMSHYSGEKEHGLKYKSNYKGYTIHCEIVTPVLENGEFGNGKRCFYAGDFKGTFNTSDELKQFIDRKVLKLQGK